MTTSRLVIQHDEPSGPDRAANWLPAPAGRFRPLLRMYSPEREVFDGRYELPPIARVQPHSHERTNVGTVPA